MTSQESLLAELLAALEENAALNPEEWLQAHPEAEPSLLLQLEKLQAAGALTRTGAPPPLPSRYRHLEPHLAGGMGDIWLAQDAVLGHPVAIKVMKFVGVDAEETRRRFLAEGRLTARLAHPGIVPVHDLGELTDGRAWFAMKFVNGRNLSEVLERLESGDAKTVQDFPLRRRVEIAIRICEALAYAHAQQALHLDLKPANIMVGEFGEVLLLDWGIAQADLVSPEPDNTWKESMDAAGVPGTPPYMAPEQAAGEPDRIDARTDVFGIGALLRHLFAGEPPYTGKSRAEVRWAASTGAQHDPEMERTPWPIPRELRAICQKALAIRRKDRYENIEAVGQDLRAWLEDRAGMAWRDSVHVRILKWARRQPGLAAMLLFLPLGILATVTAVLIGQKELQAEESLRLQAESWTQTLRLREALRNLRALGVGFEGGSDQIEIVPLVETWAARLKQGGFDIKNQSVHELLSVYRQVEAKDAEISSDLVRSLSAMAWRSEISGLSGAARQSHGQAPGYMAGKQTLLLPKFQNTPPQVLEIPVKIDAFLDRLEGNSTRIQLWHLAQEWYFLPGGVPEKLTVQNKWTQLSTSPLEPKDAAWLARLILDGLGNRSQAIDILRRQVKKDSSDFWATFLLAKTLDPKYSGPKTLSEKRYLFERSVALEPNSAWAWDNLANVQTAQGETEAAIESLQHALSLKSKLAMSKVQLGRLIQTRNPEQAARLFSEAPRDEPRNPRVWLGCGRWLLEQGKTEQALEAFKTAYLNNHSAEIDIWRAALLGRLAAGDFTGVDEQLTLWEKAGWVPSSTRFVRASYFVATENALAALPLLEKSVGILLSNVGSTEEKSRRLVFSWIDRLLFSEPLTFIWSWEWNDPEAADRAQLLHRNLLELKEHFHDLEYWRTR
ncbi:MAG: hypothetical protein DWQ01_15140 [Planctomycetota bacterium]|nr:MAG: hypothetical protein DWQ01_15140 [Planctomycetota bacterium]